MKNYTLLFLLLAIAQLSFAQQPNSKSYHYKIDLNEVNNDQLQVELLTPKFKENIKTFHLPKIIPGTYSIYDFGRFASNMKAYDKRGRELEVTHPTPNSWRIYKAKKLKRLVYTVDDSWDDEGENHVFEPGGTNIEAKKNFVLNNHGFFGYFEGQQRRPFFLDVKKPNNFFGASSLKKALSNSSRELLVAKNYNELVDAPVMYANSDNKTIRVGEADVLISVYSPNKIITADYLADLLDPLLQAQREYLGGKLPVDRYAFIIYLTDGFTFSGGYGALEHSYSSFYVLPEADPEQIAQTIVDVSAHEFFHIVTPLNIHSEEIHNFNYSEPEMSQHLWMYEGVTEYSAGHVQVKHGLMPTEDFLEWVAEKVRGAEKYKDELPFTKMSSGCLHQHKDQYLNVYQKGALIGLCLDVKLRILSDGEYGIQNLMRDLARTYGKDQPFVDEELFAKITELTYPEVGDFLNRYVAGTAPLPLQELLAEVGIDYAPEKTVKEITIGGLETAIGVNYDTGEFFIADESKLDEFGKAIGFKAEDQIVAWNGTEMNFENVNEVLGGFVMGAKEGDAFSATVLRNGAKKELTTKVIAASVAKEHVFSVAEKPSAKQEKLRISWIDR